MSREPPAGFLPHTRRSPVTDAWEPIYACRDDGTLRLGLWIAQAHCNSRGLLHGGVVATLADNAMGLACGMAAAARDPAARAGAVTLGLTLDYLDAGRPGAWLEVRPRVLKLGRSVAFADAMLVADDHPVARASASFKL